MIVGMIHSGLASGESDDSGSDGREALRGQDCRKAHDILIDAPWGLRAQRTYVLKY